MMQGEFVFFYIETATTTSDIILAWLLLK